jgi:tRNA (cytidine/uridine-2'-O-)-methyltransferase
MERRTKVKHEQEHSAAAVDGQSIDVVVAPRLHVVLDRPAIAGNVGACVRLCAAVGAALHVCGSSLSPDDREMWRAGLDYWANARVHFHDSLAACLALLGRDPWIIEVGGSHTPWQVQLAAGDVVVLGPEKGSVDDALRARLPERILTLPQQGSVRSLNLAQVAAVVAFEAVRQQTSGLASP